MSIFLNPKQIGIGPGNCNDETISINGTHSHQGVTFHDDANDFAYKSRFTIYRGEAPIIWLDGKVANNLIWSIIDGSSDTHLKVLRDGIAEELERRGRQTRTKAGHVQPVR